ncbi:MAG: hypothetical protein M3R57_08100 [Chloroflexota bacterium]|nr:hypothetical protein [Chloroflexota bacterium]
MPRSRTHAVLLGDGRVLVVGNEAYEVTDDSVNAELWDPATESWQLTMSLNKPRGDFAAVPLADGRALVTGGFNQVNQSFSSTYLYDPQRVAGGSAKGWSASGLLDKARTAPAAAVLSDGRVLVAGGYFRVEPNYGAGTIDAVLAAYRPGAVSRTTIFDGPLADIDAPPIGAAMATAELFDPATGKWSDTGPLRYARFGAAAVTLADGRILVVGSAPGESGVTLDAAAYHTAELYDPAAGRFSLTGSLPDIDRTLLEEQRGPSTNVVPEEDPVIDDVGTLVALGDGGAVLIAHSGWWKHVGEITRSFRYDARTGSWAEIGQTYVFVGEPDPVPLVTEGVRRLTGAMVARLPDGRIVVAGGAGSFVADDSPSPDQVEGTSATAEVYDATTNTWSPLPPMPEPRAGGAIVTLPDGSILFVGGYRDAASLEGLDRVVLASAIRFVP